MRGSFSSPCYQLFFLSYFFSHHFVHVDHQISSIRRSVFVSSVHKTVWKKLYCLSFLDVFCQNTSHGKPSLFTVLWWSLLLIVDFYPNTPTTWRVFLIQPNVLKVLFSPSKELFWHPPQLFLEFGILKKLSSIVFYLFKILPKMYFHWGVNSQGRSLSWIK